MILANAQRKAMLLVMILLLNFAVETTEWGFWESGSCTNSFERFSVATWGLKRQTSEKALSIEDHEFKIKICTPSGSTRSSGDSAIETFGIIVDVNSENTYGFAAICYGKTCGKTTYISFFIRKCNDKVCCVQAYCVHNGKY